MDKVKYWLAKFLLQFIKSHRNKFVSISTGFISQAEEILIIDSEEDSNQQLINELLNFLSTRKIRISIVLAAKKLSTIAEHKGINFFTYNPTDENILGFPTRNFLSNLLDKNFDLAIDLNKDENIFAFLIIKKTKAKYYIGFTKPNADKYYNFQIASQTNSENSIKNLLNCFKMF